MNQRVRATIAPAYLFLCLLLGGSAQGVWGNFVLQLLAVAIIGWAFIERRHERLPRIARQLLILIALAILLVAIQLLPLPASIWMSLPGRELVVGGFQLLGIQPGTMPISLSPYDSFATSLALLPPLAMFAAMVGLRAYSTIWLAASLIGGAVIGVLLGILQVSSPAPEVSSWYLYRVSNFGFATGFFANSNHMATLLLVTIPFIAAVGATLRDRGKNFRTRSAGLILVSSGLVLAILGLVLNRSLAGYGLGVPVVLASLTILFAPAPGWTRRALIAVFVAGIAAIALLWTSPLGSQADRLGAANSVGSRQEIAANSLDLAATFAPIGSGLGTFAKLYPLSEDPAQVGRDYVNHAHNDYLELAVETGVPGLLLILLFLTWWAAAVWRMLRSPASDQFAMAGAIASAAVLLHSVVDYPVRTAAIATVFAMSLALIFQSRRSAHSDKDIRPVRHVVVD